jgi:glycosyltransferase involved in cell wall biosynthesis
MHIAFITVGDTTRLTGGYLYHARLFEGLRARGIAVDEIVPCGASLAEQQAIAARWGESWDPRGYNAVVIDALARGVVAPWIARWRESRPVVVLVHQLPSIAEADDSQVALERALEQPLLEADRLIAVSEHGRKVLIARGVAAERVAVVSPGFDRLTHGEPQRATSHAPAGEHTGSPLRAHPQPPNPDPRSRTRSVLTVAQWIPRKGLTTLVEAWTRAAVPDATLELIGETAADPAYAAEVRRLIAQDRRGSIVVRGAVTDDELRESYRRADVFVLPSRFEGYGMVYAEALSYGLPIVACDVGPVPDLVTREAGIFVPPDDSAALAAALARLMDDAALRQRMAEAARARAESLPRWDDTARQFAIVLQSPM